MGPIFYFFGKSVSNIGDVNGDGYSDLAATCQAGKFGACNFIYFGGSNIDSTFDVVIQYGNSPLGTVSGSGDVNGDGYDDVIVRRDSDVVKICYGGLQMDGEEDVVIHLNSSSASFAGDLNGDNYSDIIIGIDGNSSDSGIAFIYFGNSNIDTLPDVKLKGEVLNNLFGCSVYTAGDVNNDGFSDVIIGGSGFSSNQGRSYIFYGGASMNSRSDIIMTGESAGSLFGNSVSTAGDLNLDGYSDVVVGAPGYNANRGRVYLYTSLLTSKLINPINNSINNPTIINFIWSKLDFISNYKVKMSSDSVFTNFVFQDSLYSDTSRISGPLQRNSKYYWAIEATDYFGVIHKSEINTFRTIPSVFLNLKILFEGMYFNLFNQLSRRDSLLVLLRNVNTPYSIVDSAISIIDSNSFSALFNFKNSYAGSYYIVAKHFNSIETWSKPGGTILINDGYIYSYDFTSSIAQAYGNNLKFKGSKYCIYSGDIDQSGFIDVTDVLSTYNKTQAVASGNHIPEDLNADLIVDVTDLILCYNNARALVGVIAP